MKFAAFALVLLALTPVFSLLNNRIDLNFPIFSGIQGIGQAGGVPTETPNNKYANLPTSGMPSTRRANKYDLRVTSGMPIELPLARNPYIRGPSSVIIAQALAGN